MATRIRIKKSKNVHAWSNHNVGKHVKVSREMEDAYEIIFLENPNITGINTTWLTGLIFKEDATLL